MASVGVDFCKFLRANTSIAAKVGPAVYHRHVPQPPPSRFIYLVREGFRHERCLGEAADPAFSHYYAVEAIAENEEEADAIADIIRGLDGRPYGTTFGGRTLKGLFIEEQSDDYEPKAVGSDLGYHIPALRVEVIPT
jgi:hypothetical protein